MSLVVRREPFSPVMILAAAGLLLLAAGAGLLANLGRVPPTPLLLVLASPLLAAVGWAMLHNADVGVGLLPIVGAAVPVAVATGTQSPIVAALALAVLLCFLGLLRAVRAMDWGRGASVKLPAVALMITWVLAYFWGNIELNPLVTFWPSFPVVQIGALAVLLLSVGVLLLAMSVDSHGVWLPVATWGLIACGVVALVGYFSGFETQISAVMQTGGLFTLWVVALSYSQGVFNQRLPMPLRLGLVALALGWEFKAMVLQTWWFSGWLPTLVALVVITFLRSKRWFFAVLLAGGAAATVNFNALYHAVWGTTVSKGDLTRLDIWRQSLDLFSQHMLFGTGPAGYAVYFQSIYAGSAFSMVTHNNYMDVLMETGILGEIVFVWFLLAALVAIWRSRAHLRTGFDGALAQGVFAGFVGVLVAMSQGDWFIPFVYNVGIVGFRFTVHSWVFLGFGLALAFRKAPDDTLVPGAEDGAKRAAAGIGAMVPVRRNTRLRRAG